MTIDVKAIIIDSILIRMLSIDTVIGINKEFEFIAILI